MVVDRGVAHGDNAVFEITASQFDIDIIFLNALEFEFRFYFSASNRFLGS